MPKTKVIYSEKFRKNTNIEPEIVTKLITDNKTNISSEILERGKLSDGSEFITVKLIVKT